MIHPLRLGARFGDKLVHAIEKTTLFFDAEFITAIEEYFEHHSRLSDYIGPLHTYIGGGWSIEGYKTYGLTLLGIRQIFKLLHQPIPVIASKEGFQTLINNTPMGTQCVAVVSSHVFQETAAYGLHVFAVCYEKQRNSETLFIYDSQAMRPSYVSYFKSSATVFFPNKNRQRICEGEATCHAYAIRDALILQAQLQASPPPQEPLIQTLHYYVKGFFDPPLPPPKIIDIREFTLSETFFYDATLLKKELFISLIDHVEYVENETPCYLLGS